MLSHLTAVFIHRRVLAVLAIPSLRECAETHQILKEF